MSGLLSAPPSQIVSLSAKQFGAVGSGAVDDAPAISAGIAAAAAANLPFYLPIGTYLMSSTVSIDASNVEIFGAGAGSTTIRFASNTRDAFKILTGRNHVHIHDLFFQGDSSDDKDVNFGAGVVFSNGSGLTTDLGVTDVSIHDCTFDHCTPVESDDSFHTGRMRFSSNYIHNPPNGMHPPSDSSIQNCDFVNDTFLSSRSEFIYQFGQQCDLTILNCRFKNGGAGPDVQIRSTGPRFNQRFNFRIEGCHFENTNGYSIWVGSDDKPDITDIVITGNTFRNCVGPINCRGGGVISNNNMMWDWENPNSFSPGSGVAIGVLGGQGASGARSTLRGMVVSGNRFVHRHPWVGTITIGAASGDVASIPHDGDTVTVGAFVYTWKTTPSSEGDVQIGVDTTHCATNLVATLQGSDTRMTAPNNVLRNVTDTFSNPFAFSNNEINGNLVVIASWQTFSMAETGDRVTLVAAKDMRDACTYAINVGNIISPLVQGNLAQDFNIAVAVSDSVEPSIYDNVLSIGVQNGSGSGFKCVANNKPHWKGNRITVQYAAESNIGAYPSCTSAFPVIEDLVYARQLSVRACGGRSGIVPVGDGYAYTYLYYGDEQASAVQPYTRPWRWDDGDQILLAGNTYTFKRSSPGANQFNAAGGPTGLVTLINSSTYYQAAFETLVNDYGASDPQLWIKIKARNSGAAYNGSSFYVKPVRYKKPSDASVYTTVPGPLINAIVLREPNQEYAALHGGANTLIKTFVMSPIVSADRGVFVQGVDATSQALAPVVYAADIIPGVGFTITHGTAAGTESFFYRVN